MNKYIIALLIICAIASLTTVTAGNNTTVVDNPTAVYINSNETITALESGDSNIQFSDGYKGYCIEWGEHSAEKDEIFYVTDSSGAVNKITDEDISNNLKVMFLFFYDRTQENHIATQHMIWKFTNSKEFSKFDKDWYNEIIELSDKYEVPDSGTIKINDTHEFIFDFKVFIAKFLEYQNYFGYKFYVRNISTNVSDQIINSTINNLSTNSTTDLFNDGCAQYNGTCAIEIEKEIKKSTSNNIFLHKTGIKTDWMFLCIIILLIIACVSYKKS